MLYGYSLKTKFMDFTSQLSGHDVTVLNISYYKDIEIESTCTINWQFYTEMRDWGVKDVCVYATKVFGEIEVTNEDKVETQEITSDADGWVLDTETDNLEWGHAIKPQDLQIDFKNKIITVIF